MSVLERLYNGEICPLETIIPRKEDYRPLCEKIGREKEYFTKRLPKRERERFREWNESIFQYEKMSEYANFSCGFRLGAALMIEILAGLAEETDT